MNKNKPPPAQTVVVPASRLIWDDERLRALDKHQLANLLTNLQTQLDIGRISDETAVDLQQRILSLLPKSARPKNRTLDLKATQAADAEGSNRTESEK